jgi:hypothetical protein
MVDLDLDTRILLKLIFEKLVLAFGFDLFD